MIKRLLLMLSKYKFRNRVLREDMIRTRERARKPLNLPQDELDNGTCGYALQYPEDE